jgi:diacylglycerol kinase family enzyme
VAAVTQPIAANSSFFISMLPLENDSRFYYLPFTRRVSIAAKGSLFDNDGLIDLCLVGQVSQARILPVALKFISGTQVGHPAVQMVRARQISVRAVQGSIPAHADGETVCTAGMALSVEIVACALEIVTYSNGAAA